MTRVYQMNARTLVLALYKASQLVDAFNQNEPSLAEIRGVLGTPEEICGLLLELALQDQEAGTDDYIPNYHDMTNYN